MLTRAMPRTLYVAHDGNNSNSGIRANAPLATLNAAMTRLAAVGGGTVYVETSFKLKEWKTHEIYC